MTFQLKEFALLAEEGIRKLDEILQGQADAKKRMVDLIEALKTKDELDEGVLSLMNGMAEQILEVAGNNAEAIALADVVRERADLVAKMLAEKSFEAMQSRGMKKDGE